MASYLVKLYIIFTVVDISSFLEAKSDESALFVGTNLLFVDSSLEINLQVDVSS